jgi:hypothetical protein
MVKKKTENKQEEVNTIEVPITVNFDNSTVIGIAKIVIGEHLTLLPNMVLAPSYEVKSVEFNEAGEATRRELNLLSLSMITPQVANPAKVVEAE